MPVEAFRRRVEKRVHAARSRRRLIGLCGLSATRSRSEYAARNSRVGKSIIGCALALAKNIADGP